MIAFHLHEIHKIGSIRERLLKYYIEETMRKPKKEYHCHVFKLWKF